MRTENDRWIRTTKHLGAVVAVFVVYFALAAGTGAVVDSPVQSMALANFLMVPVALWWIRFARLTPGRTEEEPLSCARRLDPAATGLLVLCAAATWVAGQATSVWVQRQGLSPAFERYAGAQHAESAVVLLVAVVLLAPVAEELVMRGVVYGHLRKVAPVWPAVLVSTSVFVLLHGTLAHVAFTALMGVLLALVYEATRTIVYPVLVHMALNAASVFNVLPVAALATPAFLVVALPAALACIGWFCVATGTGVPSRAHISKEPSPGPR